MDSIKSLTGPELQELYLRDKSNDHLKQPENLKTLLTYVLNKDMRELTDSDWEIVDFCKKILQPEDFPNEQKIQFLRDKYALIRKERAKRRTYGTMKRIAACIVFVIFGGVLVLSLGGTESEAGVFDWVRSLFVEEDGEQLVISTPDATLKGIEMKEGHLPDRLPDEFSFEKSRTDVSSYSSFYHYYFKNISNDQLLIVIQEFRDTTTIYQNELEISKSSTKTVEKNNQTYYYIINDNNNCISWFSNSSLYSVLGPFSFPELENIISYYN